VTVRVVTDSACDLPVETCEELGIEVVPLTIRFGDVEYVDRVELDSAAFWSKVAESEMLPETAAPSVGAFEETFRRLADEGASAICCVNLSSALSATMQSAQVASKALEGGPPIEIIDSKTATLGIGMLAEHAARRARDGADLATVTAEVLDLRSRQHLFGTLATLDFLKKGGRIGGAQALVGSMLSIKPMITVADGRVEEAGKVRTRSKALRFLVDRIKESSVEELAVAHAQADDVDELIAMLEPIVPGTIRTGIIGPVVGVHAGPGTVGVSWFAAS
jgi:DegV family protein with EDD domain